MSTNVEPKVISNETDLNEIVTPSEEIAYGIYSETDLDNYIKEIDSLNYIELTQLQNQTKANLEMLKQVMNLLDTIDTMPSSDSINKKLMQTNMLHSNGIDTDIDTFKKNYESDKNNFNRMLEAIETALHKYDSDVKGTTFFTAQMVILLEKKKRMLDIKHPNYNNAVKKYDTAISAFINRDDFTYIKHAITTTCSNKRTMKAFWKDVNEKCMRNSNKMSFYISDLKKFFNDDQLGRFRDFCIKSLHMDAISICLLYYVFSRILKNNKNDGSDTYVKVFVLNILDYISGGYDYYSDDNSIDNEKGFLIKIKEIADMVKL